MQTEKVCVVNGLICLALNKEQEKQVSSLLEIHSLTWFGILEPDVEKRWGDTALILVSREHLETVKSAIEDLKRNSFFRSRVWLVGSEGSDVMDQVQDWFAWPKERSRLECRLKCFIEEEKDHQKDRALSVGLEVKSASLRRDIHQLERQNEDLQGFCSTLAHDLKHPLNTITSYINIVLDMLKENEIDKEEMGMMVDRAHQSSIRISGMIRDLLASAKQEEGEVIAAISLDEVISDVVNDLDELASRMSARISVGPLPEIMGCRPQFYQVFSNLITNAIKFSKEGEPPLVEVKSVPIEHRGEVDGVKIFQIIIQDNGIGIAQEDFDRLFKPFSRLDAAKAIEGSGLGLATVKKIIGLHAGSIKIESRLGHFTRFIITLPVNLSDQAVPFFRKEMRFEHKEEKVLWSKIYRPDNKSYMLSVINESEKGLCCRCMGEHNLSQGDIIELDHFRKFSVRWIKQEGMKNSTLGLKMVE